MTKLEALVITRDLFRWLARNPSKWKEDCPKPDMSAYLNRCACCEFARTVDSLTGELTKGVDCSVCPMLTCWPERCYMGVSPYALYNHNSLAKENHSERTRLATIIANHAAKLIRKERKSTK
jgi:hypothetical protein